MVKRVRPSEAICQGEEDSVLLNDDATEANVQQRYGMIRCTKPTVEQEDGILSFSVPRPEGVGDFYHERHGPRYTVPDKDT